MGDGGSYLLGSLFFISVYIYNAGLNNGGASISLITLILILFFALFDMTYVVLHRIANATPFLPDRQHIHHSFKNWI